MDSCLPTRPSKSAPRVYYHLEESASKATKEETVKKEKEKEGSGWRREHKRLDTPL